MIQIVATFSDDNELTQLRDMATKLGLFQAGNVARRTFYSRVKFCSIANDSNGKGVTAKPGTNSTLERNKNKYSE